MLADAEGDLVSLELSNTRHAIRRPHNGDDALFHTNHFRTPEMREVEVSPEAIFGKNAPTALRGIRVLESAEVRWGRFEHLLDAGRRFGPDELADLMSDHGARRRPPHALHARRLLEHHGLLAVLPSTAEDPRLVLLGLRRQVHRFRNLMVCAL